MCYCITWALVSCFMDDPAKGEWWLLHSRILKYECNSFWFVLFYILYLLTNSCWYSGWYCDVQLRWNLLGIVILEFPLWINLRTFRFVLYYYTIVWWAMVVWSNVLSNGSIHSWSCARNVWEHTVCTNQHWVPFDASWVLALASWIISADWHWPSELLLLVGSLASSVFLLLSCAAYTLDRVEMRILL